MTGPKRRKGGRKGEVRPLPPEPRYTSAGGLARMLGITVDQVEPLCAAGVFTRRESDNRFCTFDADACTRAYIDHLRHELAEAQARAALGNGAVLDCALRLKNRLILHGSTEAWSLRHVERTWLLLLASVTKAMLDVPERVYKRLPSLARTEAAIIEQEIARALNDIARGTGAGNGHDIEEESEEHDAQA